MKEKINKNINRFSFGSDTANLHFEHNVVLLLFLFRLKLVYVNFNQKKKKKKKEKNI